MKKFKMGVDGPLTKIGRSLGLLPREPMTMMMDFNFPAGHSYAWNAPDGHEGGGVMVRSFTIETLPPAKPGDPVAIHVTLLA